MDETLRGALDQVHVEQELKDRTMAYLQAEMRKRQKPARPVLRLAITMAAVAAFALSGFASYRFYAAPSAYVDLDVNPSIELTLNRFGRVLSTQAHNGDGAELLQEINLRRQSCEDAVQDLLGAMIDQGLLVDGLVSVTIQGRAEQELAASLRNTVNTIMSEHHAEAVVEVLIVSNEVKAQAESHHLSPAKYLAIQALQQDDPLITFESCAGHSLGELRDQARHSTVHHGQEEAKHEANADAPKHEPAQSQNNQGCHANKEQHHGQGGHTE